MKPGKSSQPVTPSAPKGPKEHAHPAQPTTTSTEAIQPAAEPVVGYEAEESVGEQSTLNEVAAGIVEPDQSTTEDPQERIKKLKGENVRLLDQLLRKQAEFDNFRKRNEREKAEFMRFANFEMVRDLLPVLDGFERALQVDATEGNEGLKKGMSLVFKQLLDSLKKAGLQPLESVGMKFDPNFHQAVAHEKREDVDDSVVVEEFQRGYLFQGRLLRAAMVKVADGRKAALEEEEKESKVQ